MYSGSASTENSTGSSSPDVEVDVVRIVVQLSRLSGDLPNSSTAVAGSPSGPGCSGLDGAVTGTAEISY